MQNIIHIGRHTEERGHETEILSVKKLEKIIDRFKKIEKRRATIILEFGYCLGGNAAKSLELAELILNSKKTVIAVAKKERISSMAALIFIACDERQIPALPEFRMVFHPIQLSFSSALLDHEGRIPRKDFQRMQSMNAKMAAIMVERSRLHIDQIDEIFSAKGDAVFTGEQVLRAWLADGVVS